MRQKKALTTRKIYGFGIPSSNIGFSALFLRKASPGLFHFMDRFCIDRLDFYS
jgi:hypothetical protein